jgi:hypothetical protein
MKEPFGHGDLLMSAATKGWDTPRVKNKESTSCKEDPLFAQQVAKRLVEMEIRQQLPTTCTTTTLLKHSEFLLGHGDPLMNDVVDTWEDNALVQEKKSAPTIENYWAMDSSNKMEMEELFFGLGDPLLSAATKGWATPNNVVEYDNVQENTDVVEYSVQENCNGSGTGANSNEWASSRVRHATNYCVPLFEPVVVPGEQRDALIKFYKVALGLKQRTRIDSN